MNAFMDRVSTGHRRKARAEGDALSRQLKPGASTWTLDDDDDNGCRQRNSAPAPDGHLIRAVTDLEN